MGTGGVQTQHQKRQKTRRIETLVLCCEKEQLPICVWVAISTYLYRRANCKSSLVTVTKWKRVGVSQSRETAISSEVGSINLNAPLFKAGEERRIDRTLAVLHSPHLNKILDKMTLVRGHTALLTARLKTTCQPQQKCVSRPKRVAKRHPCVKIN